MISVLPIFLWLHDFELDGIYSWCCWQLVLLTLWDGCGMSTLLHNVSNTNFGIPHQSNGLGLVPQWTTQWLPTVFGPGRVVKW